MRPQLALATWEWESGLDPDAVGDPKDGTTKADLLNLAATAGFSAAVATQHSIGLGQINAVNWTPPLAQWFDPGVNASWSAGFLESLLDTYNGNEYLASSAYRGPGVTAASNDWTWDYDRTNWIVNEANRLAQEGVTRGPGGTYTGPTVPTSPATRPTSGASLSLQLQGLTLLEEVETNG